MTSDEKEARQAALESYIPTRVGTPGMRIHEVEKIMGHARNVVLHCDNNATTLQRWRDWYGLWTQMIADGHETVPRDYRWDPTTLTC